MIFVKLLVYLEVGIIAGVETAMKTGIKMII
jgi:hypothetical protein